jgi:hypothetical protein
MYFKRVGSTHSPRETEEKMEKRERTMIKKGRDSNGTTPDPFWMLWQLPSTLTQ